MSVKLRWILFALCSFPFMLPAQTVITVTDASFGVGATVNWTSNNIYIMDGLVYVDSASVLNIEAGTVIKGKLTPTTGDNTSALIIARYGKINATGTAANPIIFTAESDDVTDPDDLGVDDRGLWGGIIILGNAQINTTSGIGQIEGIATTEPRGSYGGDDDTDNSGVLRYVSIRHGGSEIGSGNEINGLTMGGVGNGTLIEYIEVLSNLDDGYEWFGGTVNSKYLVAAFCADDAFDFDEGWTGKNQFWFALQGTDFAGRIAEQDGGTTPEDGLPFAIPLIYNATYIGPGTAAAPQGDGAEALIFRDNAGGKYYNSIITEYNGGSGGKAITVEDLVSGADSRERLEMGDLVLNNNIWWNFGAGNDVNTMITQDFVRTHFNANNNQIVDPQLRGISRTSTNVLDPRPSATGPAATGAAAPSPSDAFFTNVAYYGAFSPTGPAWIGGWTAISQYGILTSVEVVNSNVPSTYTLSQNYPNPFNPSTVISFSVVEAGNVSLKIFDMLGREVATLVDGFQEAGSYKVQFDASGLSTGMYLYRISAGNFHEVRKMMLTK